MNIGKIYKITNKINQKVYIGSTINSLAKRWGGHVYASKTENYKFSRAIRKYGYENFKIEWIASSIKPAELDSLEEFFISFYDSINSGYNSVPVGKNRELITKFMQNEWKNLEKRQLRIQKMKEGSKYRSKAIIGISIYDSSYKIFETINEAKFQFSMIDLYNSLKKLTVKSQGYVWFYYDKDNSIDYYINEAKIRLGGQFLTNYTKPIISHNIVTGECKEYESLQHIDNNLYQIKYINRVLKGQYNTYKDCTWKFK